MSRDVLITRYVLMVAMTDLLPSNLAAEKIGFMMELHDVGALIATNNPMIDGIVLPLLDLTMGDLMMVYVEAGIETLESMTQTPFVERMQAHVQKMLNERKAREEAKVTAPNATVLPLRQLRKTQAAPFNGIRGIDNPADRPN